MTYQFQHRSDAQPAETAFLKSDLEDGIPIEHVVFRSGLAASEDDARKMLAQGLIRQRGADHPVAPDTALRLADLGDDGAVLTGQNAAVRRILSY